MLEINLTILSLLLLLYITKKYWHITLISITACAIYAIIKLPYRSRLINTSSYTIRDSLTSTMVVLSIWISSLILLARYKIFNIKNTPKIFILTRIMLLLALTISFSVSSLLHFYVAFEASLIPTILLIILWGYQPERIQARIYLILYTVSASLPLLLIIIKVKWNSFGLLNITMPEQLSSFIDNQPILWLFIIMAFLVKLPIFTVHLWLPKAHVEAPVAGSIILAAVLLKLGGYGLARAIIIFRYINKYIATPIISISLVGGVITSIICIRQSDIKSLIAYSSVGHIGLMLAAIITGSKLGIQARMSIMLAHGLSSSAIFCMANTTYNITITRRLTLTKGLLSIIPIISFWWFIFCCANIAAPPRINLISEIFLIIATIRYSLIVIIPLRLISFVTVVYSLYLYSATNHGPSMSSYNPIPHITLSDIILIVLHLVPIILLILKPELIIIWC